MHSKKEILLVEDDESMGYLLKDNLESNGYIVTHVTDGHKALQLFEQSKFTICILDIMLPKIDGFSLGKLFKSKKPDVPILFLSAKNMREDRIRGLKIGADDYVTKPFSMEELILRIQVILRREVSIKKEQTMLLCDSFSLDTFNLILHRNNQEIQLTQKEAAILQLFMEHKNILLRREFILKRIWNDDSYFLGRSLDVFISKLRKHLSGDTNIKIKNIHGTGYKLQVISK